VKTIQNNTATGWGLWELPAVVVCLFCYFM